MTASGEAPPQQWLRELSSEPWPQLRLVCLPHAGGSAASYRSWPQGLPRGVEVLAAELPGRATRHTEPPSRLLDAIVAGVAGALGELPPRRLVLLGHSFGAIVGFELARRLRREGSGAPELLVVAAREAPQVPLGRDRIYALPDAAFLEALERLGGTPPEILSEPGLIAAAMPALRADFEIADTYARDRVAAEPQDMPILALGGLHDPDVEPSQLEGWGGHTTAEFRSVLLPGGHFFLVKEAEPLALQLIARELESLLETAAP